MSHSHDGSCCQHQVAPSVHQTIDEMEFERGLWSAALSGETDRVASLIKDGRDPCQPDSSGYTALHYAARSGHIDVCRLLLDGGACVNAKTRSGGVTPLHRAAYCGHEGITKLLLSRGADVHLQDSDGMNALHKACERQQLLVSKLLLSKDSSLKDIIDKRGNKPINYVKDNNDKWKELMMG